MFPSFLAIIIFILIAICISFISFIWTSKLGTYVEIIAIVLSLIYLFVNFDYFDAMIIFSFAMMTYAHLTTILTPEKGQFRRKLIDQLRNENYETIDQPKQWQRLATDLVIMFIVSSGALIFLIWAPETFAALKYFIGISFITIGFQMISRIANYATTSMYFLKDSKRLIIISLFESRDFPIDDVEKVTAELQPDILRLHPLFTFLASMQDYTTAHEQVLRLNFPGEHIYLTPTNVEKWHDLFAQHISEDEQQAVENVKPFWHPTNLKRLLWKGYFAITVKGISAYTGLLIVLIWLNVPSYGIFIFIFIWWVFNLYVSDRVLIASTDAVRVQEGYLYEIVQLLSKKATIKQPQLFLIDSPVHNGLATGMNIGRGTIMLTTATTQLSTEAVQAIIAHEIAHIKKRDILVNQIARMMFFLVVGFALYFSYDQLLSLMENIVLFTILIYILMMLFPIYLSLVSQYTEMRADYLAASLLDDAEQMASGLYELGVAQDAEIQQSYAHEQVDDEHQSDRSVVERGQWFFRLIEFQFQLHPPLYFRIYSLENNETWKETVYTWIKARMTESLPDLFGRKSKYS